jgi:hypothetical protein
MCALRQRQTNGVKAASAAACYISILQQSAEEILLKSLQFWLAHARKVLEKRSAG